MIGLSDKTEEVIEEAIEEAIEEVEDQRWFASTAISQDTSNENVEKREKVLVQEEGSETEEMMGDSGIRVMEIIEIIEEVDIKETAQIMTMTEETIVQEHGNRRKQTLGELVKAEQPREIQVGTILLLKKEIIADGEQIRVTMKGNYRVGHKDLPLQLLLRLRQ